MLFAYVVSFVRDEDKLSMKGVDDKVSCGWISVM